MTTKMYIAVLETVPDHMVPVLVAHTVLGAHLIFDGLIPEYNSWLVTSFKKVVLRVNQKEFDKISFLNNIYIGHENTVLNASNSCIAVCPREENEAVLRFAKLWKPK